MAKQIINIGSTANDGTGDPIRTAFQKAMSNFDELYTGSTSDVDSLIAGAGISVDQATGNVTVTNTAPDQTVTLTSGANVTITGTYPNFTISSDDVVGAVNSVNGQTGVVVLDSADIAEDTNLYYTEARVSANTNVTANTAKVGITTQQATDITTNNAKVTANTANVTSAGALMDSEVTNLADVKAFDTTDYLASSVTTITTQQASDITTNNAKTGITSAQAGEITANNAKVSNATHTGDVTGDVALTIADDAVITSKILDANVTTAKIADDAITYAKLGDEFTTTAAVTTALDFTSAQVFTKTMTAGTTFTYSNVGIGMVKDFILTGAFVPTFPIGTKTVAGTYDGSVSNLIQIVAIASGDYWMSISKAQ